jgi:hypothetical protein
LITITILGVVIAPLAAALIVSLRTTDETSNRLASSNDAQLVAIWLPGDVQSAGNQSGDVVAAPASNTDCSGVANLLRLRWRETHGSTTTYVAAYAVRPGTDSSWRLVRYACVNSNAATTHVVARNLASSSAGSVSVNGTKVSVTLTTKSSPTDTGGYAFTVSGNRRTS